MKLLLQTLMIFFGTLLAAGVVALGEPAHMDGLLAMSAPDAAPRAGDPPVQVVAAWLGLR
jgi:hypothetical protein